MNKTVGIYCIINTKNNKIYIGSTKNILKRLNTHFNSLKKNKHRNYYLQKEFNKYKKYFGSMILEKISNLKFLISREQYWIDYYDSYDKDYGYNLVKIAGYGGRLGIKFSKKSLEKMRKSQQKIKRFGKNNPMSRKNPRSIKARKKIGEANKERVWTKESRRKLSEAGKLRVGEKAPMYGRTGESNPMYGVSRFGETNPFLMSISRRRYLKNKAKEGIDLTR
jgi:group I intron endonuclease